MKCIAKSVLALFGGCLIFSAPQSVSAFWHGSPAIPSAQIGISDVLAPSFAFLDQMKGWSISAVGAGNSANPGLINSDGLPLDGTLASDLSNNMNFPTTASGYLGNWKIRWSGTGGAKLALGSSAVTVVSNPGCTTTQNSSTTAFTGANCTATITFAATHSVISFAYPAGTYSGMTGLSFCRSGNATPDDCTRIDNGETISPDFVASLAPLHPKTIRPMDWSGANIGSTTTYPSKRGYNPALTSVGWVAPARWAGPNVWAGTITGTDTYSSPTFTDAPASWPSFSATSSVVFWQGVFQNTNTVTTPTVVVSGITGAKTIVNTSGAALAAGDIKTDRASSLSYDPVLDKVVYAPSGIASVVPIEAQVELANKLGANLWFNYGGMVDDASVTSYVSYARDHLNNVFQPAYLNEPWNFGLIATSWLNARGAALGFPSGNNERIYGPHGLRSWQVNNLAAAAWSPRSSTQLRRVIENQAISINAAGQQKWRLNGFDLNSTNFPTYGTFTGGVNHDTYPNRPIDNSEAISYATYYQGAVMTGPGSFGGTYADADLKDCSTPGTNSGGIICAGNNYIAGGASISAAFAWLDNDIRQGTKNGTATGSTLAAFSCNSTGACNASSSASQYIVWEGVAASYDASGRAVPVRVENYEGGLQSTWPTDTNCAAMTSISFPSGIASSFTGAADCATTLQNMLTAYRNSSFAASLVTNQFQQFMGSDPTTPTFGLLLHSKTPAWFQFLGPTTQTAPWALVQGSIYATPYIQLYSGFGNFVGTQNFLLKRDLNPASNDNDPMFLEKAA
jgi:hypothetical protein